MIRLICFRQRKNLSENLRQALRSISWHSHHVADVAEVNFCLPSGIVFDGGNAIVRIRIPSALFGSQRRHRIHPSRAARREETSKKRRSREHQTCTDEGQRIRWAYLIQDFGQDAPRRE
jgi:hypothetical protein